MFISKNSKKQGDIGLGAAIAWFVANEYVVSIPLTDSQDYDLIVEKENKLYRVQVKTTSFIKNTCYEVQLSVKGGNKSGTGKIKKFDNSKIELLFVLTEDGSRYLIPAKDILAKNSLALNELRVIYKV